MPYVVNEDAEIYWEAHGHGTPVLLVMGLSFTMEMWFRLLPYLDGRHRVIRFDNRGMGRSTVPRGPYPIARMTRDAAAVMKAAEAADAHVIGASMGGMIAQELALRFPELVRTLLLACTSHSGLLGRWPDFSRLPRRAGPTREERERAMVQLLYADTTPRERIAEDIDIRSRCQWNRQGFLNQLGGILLWSSYRRLPEIRKPTLVVHGDQDRLVPPENGRVIARRIPGADFKLIPGAGHVMMTDQPELCAQAMLKFIAGQ